MELTAPEGSHEQLVNSTYLSTVGRCQRSNRLNDSQRQHGGTQRFSRNRAHGTYQMDRTQSAGSFARVLVDVTAPQRASEEYTLDRNYQDSERSIKPPQRRLAVKSAPALSTCPQPYRKEQEMMFANRLTNRWHSSSFELAALKKMREKPKAICSGRDSSVNSVTTPRSATVGRYFDIHNGLCPLNALKSTQCHGKVAPGTLRSTFCRSVESLGPRKFTKYPGVLDEWETPLLQIRRVVLFHRDNFIERTKLEDC